MNDIRRTRRIAFAICVAGLFLCAAPLLAQPPQFFTEETVTSNVSQPIGMVFLPGGRALVIQKSGEVLIGDPTTLPMPLSAYLTITNISRKSERGLLDITIDPGFGSGNDYIYVYYTCGAPQRARISRFTHIEGGGGLSSTGDLASEVVLWEDTEGYISCCHYGGGLDFGPDGRLYLTTGEKFNAQSAQDLSSANGKIIRINSDGSIPPDNLGMADGPGGTFHDAIWAYGLRNPFRARWDLATGRFFIGEVGGNDQNLSWEDLYLVTLADGGANFGWPNCEGPCDNPDFPSCNCGVHEDPVFAYPHQGVGASLTSGEIYRGFQYPSSYYGTFFYGDYARGEIRYLTFDGSGTQVTGDFLFDDSVNGPIALTQGPDGAIYYASIFGWIRRYTYNAGNLAPVIASAEATPIAGPAPLDVTFTAVVSDNEGDPMTYLWVFGDGASAAGVVTGDTIAPVLHTFVANSAYDARLEVSDLENTTISNTIPVGVGLPPVVVITSPADQSLFRAGDIISYSAVAGDPDGTLNGGNYAWTVRFQHNLHFHPGPIDADTGMTGTFAIETSGHDWHDNTAYVIDVLVTDTDGLSAADTVTVLPDKVNLTFDTVPTGIAVTIDGIPLVTPFIYDTLIGFEHAISVPTSQCVGGSGFAFGGWNNGAPSEFTLTVPGIDSTYVASYIGQGMCQVPVDSGLVMRLQADLGVTTSGSAVTGWSDQSGFGNDLDLVNGAPTLVPDVLFNNSVVSFDGVDDWMGRSGFSGLPLGAADRTMLMVVRYDSDGWGGFTYGTASCNQTFGLSIDNLGELIVQGWCSANDFSSSMVGNGTGWMTHGVVLENDFWVHYRNNVALWSGSHTFNTGTSSVRLATTHDESDKVNMQVAEILVYDRALSTPERALIEDYFRNVYLGPQLPTIALSSPSEAEIVLGDSVTASWVSSGDLAQAGHVHVILDDNPRVTSSSLIGSLTFNNLYPGPHTIRVELATVSHSVLATDSASFELQPAGLCDLAGDGLIFHIEADQNVDTTGSLVNGWLDRSGFGNDLNASGDPQLVITGGPNDMPFVSFDGSGDKVERTVGVAGAPVGNADRTMFFVARYLSDGYGGFAYGAPACNQTFGLAVSFAGNLAVKGWCNDFETANAGNGAGWLVQSVVLEAGSFQHYLNGAVIDAQSHVFNTDASKLVIGATLNDNPFLTVDVAAALVYNRALTDSERQGVEAYLQSRYFGMSCGNSSEVPVAVADDDTVAFGGSVAIDVTANDYDPDGVIDPATVMLMSTPTHGYITGVDSLNGVVTYQQNGTHALSDSFSYAVRDSVGYLSNQAVARVHVAVVSGAGDTPGPTQFALYQNMPNPFNPTTTIRYDVPAGGVRVELAIYDVAGRLIETLLDRDQPQGRHSAVWTGRDRRGRPVASGVYFYRLRAGPFTQTRKMVLLQ